MISFYYVWAAHTIWQENSHAALPHNMVMETDVHTISTPSLCDYLLSGPARCWR